MSAWEINAAQGADVRLRSGRIGLVNVDVSAPVRAGTLLIGSESVELALVLSLARLRTGNILMQSAARVLIARHDADELRYVGSGPLTDQWRVSGRARAGTIDVTLDLLIVPTSQGPDPGSIEITGRSSLGTVTLPLPGLGTINDFAFDVTAQLPITRG